MKEYLSHKTHFIKDWKLERTIKNNLRDPCGVVMDIGSGQRPQQYVKPAIHWCIDPTYDTTNQGKIAEEIKWSGIHKVTGTWDTALEIMKKERIDTVFLMDVIEHLPEAEGEELLERTLSFTRHQVVIFTPLGFMEQEDGEWNTHRSGWSIKDFQQFTTYRHTHRKLETWIFKGFHTVDFKNRRLSPAHDALLVIYTKIW